MQKINRESLRKIIYNEINKIGEDMVLRHQPGSQGTPPLGGREEQAAVCQVCMISPCECSMYEEDEKIVTEGCGCGGSCGCESCKSSYSGSSKDHHKGAYMSKSQLYKVAEYATTLHQMIPPGHDLEDWMRTKISQIADDISEVYHALNYDAYEDKI